MLKKDMAKEIKKYQGRIYFYEQETKKIQPANWIQSLDDYNHYEFELHHVVPYTDWEKNTKNVQEIVGKNCLIALPKVMHQHLENPLYKLSKNDFERIYGIHPDRILFDINSNVDRIYPCLINTTADCSVQSAEFLLTDEDLSCFADCEQRVQGESRYSFNASNQADDICEGVA